MNLTYYADSSVLVKRHVAEVGGAWFTNLADPANSNTIVTASLSVVEVISAFTRRKRAAGISPTDYATIVTDFLAVAHGEYRFIRLNRQVQNQARRLLETYPLRAGDAVQLASALVARNALAAIHLANLIFLASDTRLLDAARAEGFTVDDPLLHP